MYKNKAGNGLNNICGGKIKMYRNLLRDTSGKPISQKVFADLLLDEGLDLDKNAVQRIECGKRFVTDIELKVIAKVLNVTYESSLDEY